MTDLEHPKPEPAAFDDVRRVRERIAREHVGDLCKHIEETTRIAEKVRAKLNLRLISAPTQGTRRSGTQG